MAREAAVLGLLLWNTSEKEMRSIHAALAAGLENGSIRPVVGRELPLPEAPKAHHLIMEAPAYGKTVLIP
jgi:NADPH2:quinone reductase